tara:strand:+ start:97307 stop:97933 length:627 start_codon:yes stop_codon:yes gene_type:complete
MAYEFDVSPLLDRQKIKEVVTYFKGYFKNPIERVKSIPDWDWIISIATLGVFSAAGGVARGIFEANFLTIILSFIFVPIGSVIGVAIVSGFFYYTFFFFFNRELVYRQLFTAVFICSVPSLCLQALASIASPFLLLGVMATLFLMIVCFVENFQLPRKPISKLMAGIFIIYFASWVLNVIQFTNEEEKIQKRISTESLDILERDLQNK